MACIETRYGRNGQKRFRVKIRLKGGKQETQTFQLLTKARQWAQSVEAATREGRYFGSSEAKRRTLREALDRYEREVLPQKSGSTTQKTHIKWWRERLGHLYLSDVSPSKIAEARDALLNEPIPSKKKSPPPGELPKRRASSTVVRYLALLSHLFSIADREWQWVDRNPVRHIRKPKEPPGRVRFLSDDERKALLQACSLSTHPYLHTIVVLALSTGMRSGEISKLTWSDVDLQAGRILLPKTKNNQPRGVPVTGYSLTLLRELNSRSGGSNLLFPSKFKPAQPAAFRGPWVTALLKAGIRGFRFHDLRHTAASNLAMHGGASLLEIGEVLGHKTAQMTKRYAHLTAHHTRAIVERMTKKVFDETCAE